jgi:trehalose synthase
MDVPNEQSAAAWDFLRGYLEPADAFVFSRTQYAPDWVPPHRRWVIPPSIDPLAVKNQVITPPRC